MMRSISLAFGTGVVLLVLAAPALGQPDPDFVLTLTSETTPPFGAFSTTILFDNTSSSDVTGWSWGACHDGGFVDIVSVADGATTSTVNGGSPPAFNATSLFPGDGWTVGTIISFFGMEVLAPGVGYELYVASYIAGGTTGVTSIDFCDTLGIGVPVPVEIGIPGGVVEPTQISAQVTISEPPPDPDYVLSMPTVEGNGPGQPVDLPVLLDSSSGNPILGWSFNACHDPTVVDIVSVALGTAAMGVNGGAGPDYMSVTLYESGYAAAVVLDLGALTTLPPAAEHELHVATYLDLVGIVGSTEVCFCDDLNPLLGPLVVRDDSAPIVPATQCGTIEEGMPGIDFIRADVNGDGIFNGVADAVFLLAFAFSGGAPPPCLESADTNGDAVFNGVVDAVFLLAYAFSGGAEPPEPTPPFCGSDPDPASSLGCDAHPGCP